MNKPGPALNRYFPHAGPCAFCGHPDKRHRLWDAIMGQRAAGDSVDLIAWWYELPRAAVLAVLKVRPYR